LPLLILARIPVKGERQALFLYDFYAEAANPNTVRMRNCLLWWGQSTVMEVCRASKGFE
jgi:hypothetical protein